MTFEDRVEKIRQVEAEVIAKAGKLIESGSPITYSDLFVMGAIKRLLSLSSGFRILIKERNFTCCAGLLRMQVDTAARINALTIVADLHVLCAAIISGERFDKQKDADGIQLRDNHLIAALAKKYPWVSNVYATTSGFIHLSDRHLFASLEKIDDTHDDGSRTFYANISPVDPKRPDEDYFEILEAFFSATKMAGELVLGYLTFRKASIEATVGPSVSPVG